MKQEINAEEIVGTIPAHCPNPECNKNRDCDVYSDGTRKCRWCNGTVD